jgi:2-iminobutanoate/2-iminopropanoate deaminase
MSDRQAIGSEGAPAPSGSYSQGIRSAGPLLFLAGQGPFRADGSLAAGSVAEQTRQVLANLDAVARAAGGRLADAVRVGVYLSTLEHFDEMDAEYRRHFEAPLPARTTIATPLVGFDVEIDAVIALPA